MRIALCGAFVLLGVTFVAEPTSAAETGWNRDHLEAIVPLVDAAIARGDLPGCVIAIGNSEGVLLIKAFGQRTVQPKPTPMTTDTVFDLASLTKPIATTTCVMQLIERGQLRLGDRVAELLPEFGQNGKEAITVEQCLTHTAGFIPDNPVADYADGKQLAWKRIDALTPETPPGSTFRYSDVSFLVLGRLVEKFGGASLDEVAKREVFKPLGMNDTGFVPAAELRERTAPTTLTDGRWLQGEVHDPRASLLGGVAGHAGLFGTAGDLARYCRMVLSVGELDGVRVLSKAAVDQMRRPRQVGEHRRALGWDSRSSYSRNRGDLMSDAAIGHGGFTGTGVWIDPELDLFIVFLSSRLHPDGKGTVNDLIGRVGSIAAAAATSD